MAHFTQVLRHIKECLDPQSEWNRGQSLTTVIVDRRCFHDFYRDWEKLDHTALAAYAENRRLVERIRELETQLVSKSEFGQKITALCREIRKAKSLAWRDGKFEELIQLIDPLELPESYFKDLLKVDSQEKTKQLYGEFKDD